MVNEPSVVLITGAGSGIGRALAIKLAKRRWHIAALDQKTAGLQPLKEEVQQGDGVCEYREADVTDAAGLRAKAAELESRLGPVLLLIACAGTAEETPAQTMAAEQVEKIIHINLIGVSNTIAAVLPGMRQRRRGHLAAISSLASLRGLPCQMAYCASKAGLNALMESLRLDLRDEGIVVTTLCPGWTKTPQTEGQYEEADLMRVDEAAQEILKAIDRRARFHAFPRSMVWQLRLMGLLPTWLQDRLLLRRLRQLKKGKECSPAPAPQLK